MTKVKKPKIIETVGAFYYAFNTPSEDGEFNATTYETIVKSPIIKKVSVEPESETVPIRASGEDYDQVSQTSSIGIEVEVIAFDPTDLATAKGEAINTNGLVLGGASTSRPYFACGYPVIKKDGHKCLKWFPKCKLTENSEETSTSDTSYSEQTSTVNITAYSFDSDNHKFVYLDSEMASYPEDMTEDKFFAQVITSVADLNKIITPGA